MVAVGALAYATAMARRPRPCDRLGDWAVTAGAPLLIGGLLSFGVLLRELDQGREWMLLAVLVTAASDSSAFFIGRAIGKTRLAPTISPGKTWEGAFGGLLGAGGAAAASVFVLGLDATLVEALVLGALMGVVGQVGDLAESWTKRAAGAKDSGWLIPGHGGILDRLDSFVFNLVLLYYFVVWAVQ
jgi:phosphatidate cytidylyltransferase